jgi:CRISPR-associated endoribonuclease Cas6
VTFHLEACRFQLAARRAIEFPPGMAGNVLRGALGKALREVASAEDYARLFDPAATTPGPSGLSDRPRPFVLRTERLDGCTVKPGDRFCFGLNLFDARNPALEYFSNAFAQWSDVVSVEHAAVTLDLTPRAASVSRIRVEFETPTELKAAGTVGSAEFSVLLARARDRVSTLRSLYGAGPLEIDFRALTERAKFVQMAHSELRRVAVERRSSRTGQRHGIGGLVGFAEYEGDLAEFLPYLEAAFWTGVGRHCTWGNGQIKTEVLNSDF